VPRPTTTAPFAESAKARLMSLPPGRSPRPVIIPPVQKNTSRKPDELKAPPTMIEPSADTFSAWLP
jgi:hypothetical protein